MNKKLLHGFLATAIVLGGAMSVTSCKDDTEDLRAELTKKNLTLEDKLATLQAAHDALKAAQEACKQSCDTKLAELKDAIEKCKEFDAGVENLIKDYISEYVKTTELETRLQWYTQKISELETALATANNNYNALAGQITTLNTKLTSEVSNLQSQINDLKNKTGLTDEQVEQLGELQDFLGSIEQIEQTSDKDFPAIIQSALNAEQQATTNKANIEALQTTLTTLQTSLTTLQNTVGGLGSDISAIKTRLSKVETDLEQAKTDLVTASKNATDALNLANELNTKYSTLDGKVDDLGTNLENLSTELRDKIQDLETRVAANEKSISGLTTKLQAITGQLNKLVTGIVLQQVSNPAFGKINLPADIKSGMLMAYFGEAMNVQFPAISSSANEYDNQTEWLTAADQARLGIQPETFDGILGLDENKNLKLGTIYMTVNPANLDLEGTTFEFVNSKGATGSVQLSPLAKSDAELKFGFGRSAEAEIPNNLYTADAYIKVNSVEDVAPVKFTLEPGFKTQVKDMLKSRKLADAASLTKLIFEQFNNKLTANGVRASWEYDEPTVDAEGNVTTVKKRNATYSEFALAATTFKPLSYKFLYGQSFRPIGTISPIEDFELSSDINIKVPEFNFDLAHIPFNFSFGEITVSLEGKKIAVEFPKTTIFDENGNPVGTIPAQTIWADDLTSLESAISQAITKSLQTQDQKLKDAFAQAMRDIAEHINTQINEKMEQFKTDINEEFDRIVGNIEDKVNGYLGTVNRYINRLNRFINRINNILKDPNHYLQVTMLYDAYDSQLHQLSNNPALPTTFKLNGGDGLRLYATSFNGDILVPPFKKYVAVTNAYKTGTTTTDENILKAANSVENWNTVVDGIKTQFAFKLTKGYTYEIVYSSLDYHGVTSTRKFYISAE